MRNKSSSNDPQDLPAPITRACREISAFVTKLGCAREKIGQYKRSIGQHIAAIKKARPDDWENIVLAECNLSRRSAYTYMRIADGTETVEEHRAKNRERVAHHRALRNAQATNSDITARELEGKQAHIDALEAARAHDKDLAGKLLLAEIKIVGLESEIADLKIVNAELRQKLEAAAHLTTGATAGADPGPIPTCLVRKTATAASTTLTTELNDVLREGGGAVRGNTSPVLATRGSASGLSFGENEQPNSNRASLGPQDYRSPSLSRRGSAP